MRARHFAVGLIAAAVLAGTVALMRAFPVYFHGDDALYLEWAALHTSPLDAFVPSLAVLVGVFRPVQNVMWWSLYRMFGLHAAPYQVTVTLLFVLCLALLARLARRLFSAPAGVWAVAAFLLLFPYLTSVIFWFSDLTFLLEALLLLLSLNLFVEALLGRLLFRWGIAVYVLAVLAKEPAGIIVPAVFVALVSSNWHGLTVWQQRRALRVGAALLVAAVLVIAFHPSLPGRQLGFASTNVGVMRMCATERLKTYTAQLMSGAGFVALGLALFAVWRVPRRQVGRPASVTYLLLAACLAGSFAVRSMPVLAGVLLMLCLVEQLALRRHEGAAAVWFVIPFLGLMTVSFVVRTYLFEAALGLALFSGAILAEVSTAVAADLRRAGRWAAPVALTLLLGATLVIGPRVTNGLSAKLNALGLVSAARQNFRAVVDHLETSAGSHERVVVIDYDDINLNYVRDIVPLPDAEKARRQKTMMAHELAAFLRVAGRSDIQVVRLSEFFRLPPETRALLFVMNAAEDEFAASQPLERTLLFASEGTHERARLYRITRRTRSG